MESKSAAKAAKTSFKSNVKVAKVLLALSILLVLLAIPAFIMAGMLNNQKQLFIPTTAATTTKKSGNGTEFSIGQYCQYHNQCPELSFCSGTCQCPLHYYYNQTTATCILRKTNGANCTSDDECNIVMGLVCITTCRCDSEHYWNASYVVLGTSLLGRCQNKKNHGMSCTGTPEGGTGITYSNPFGSQIRRCWCEHNSWYHDLAQGRCQYIHKRANEQCLHNTECVHHGYGMCMDTFGDGVKRCAPIPIMNWYASYQWRLTLGNGNCNGNWYKCNQWRNLVCAYNTGTGICQCIDEYYYWNSTMCVMGSRYGELCSASAQCTPTAASMVCAIPFTGALFTECRCAIGTHYYDLDTERCITLKTLNGTCRENADCSGSATDSMYCGRYFGGSNRVCLCTDAFYPSGTTCVAKLAFGVACSSTAQCMNHLGQICTGGGSCGCATEKYYDSSDFRCKHLKYNRDTCTANNECWSGACSGGLCN